MTAPPTIFSSFDLIRVVNLVERTDRRREMEGQFARIGLTGDPRISFYPAIRASDPGPFRRLGSHGNVLGRIALLKEAADKNCSVLILEDDCDFLLPEVYEARLKDDWDIFYGGYRALDEDNPDQSMLIGAHCMAFSPRAAKIGHQYLSEYIKPGFQPDPIAAQEPGFDPAIRPPIDGAFVWMRRAHPELVTYFDRVSVQRASRSDVSGGKLIDRIPVVKHAVALGRKLRNRILGRRGMSRKNLRFGAGDR